MDQDSGTPVWDNTAAAVGNWQVEPEKQAEAAPEPAISKEEQARVDDLITASRNHPDKASRQKLSQEDWVKVFYGDFIRKNGRNPQAYQQADRALVLRYVQAMNRRGQELNRNQIQALVKRLSPSVARLNGSQRDNYVRSLVNRIARDPQQEQIKLHKDYAMRIMPYQQRQQPDQGSPAIHTPAVMAFYQPEKEPAKPEPPSISNEKKLYRELSMQVKAQAKRQDKKLDNQARDIEIVRELKHRGHSQEQIEKVLSQSPHIKNKTGPDKEQNIKDICYEAEQKLEEQRSAKERENLWRQTLHQYDPGR